MPVAAPFYLAWVDPDETTFGPEHHRMDEYVFGLRRMLVEGQLPMFEAEIENPNIGLLNPSRKQWAWIAYRDAVGTVTALMFGRLVGNPVQLANQTIVIQFIAEPRDFKHRKQVAAKALKALPWFAPEWVPVTQRDDPDKIIETRAAFWDVHPTTHEVLAVGITEGPAGNIDLDGEHFHDSVNTTTSQPPATAIMMDATVPWTQTSRGIVDFGEHQISSLCDAIRQEWPKPFTSLGPGYSVFSSSAEELNGADSAASISFQNNWQSTEKHHSNGDTLSTTYSETFVVGPVGVSQILTEQWQTGVIDPYAVDSDGDPDPLNIPASYNMTGAVAIEYTFQTSLVVEYMAERPRTERVIFTINADMQPVLVDADISQESEVITMTSTDVGVPIVDLLNWTSVAGQHVEVGQIIFPDDPQVPGGRTVQIAVVEGDAGTVPPDFSDIPGFTTIDGGVTWSSLGVAEPPTNAPDWKKEQRYNLGDIILPRRPVFVPYMNYISPGMHRFPPTGTALSEGQYFQFGNSFFYVTESGTSNRNNPLDFGTASVVSLNKLPSGTTYFICTQAGITGEILPEFDETLHAVTDDGEVKWTCIGTGEIPIGGTPGHIHAPSFFTQDRGRLSLEYLALLVRAKLLWRARCVDVSFQVDWDTGLNITTRNTVTLHDDRLAGGLIVGKVKSAVLSVSDTGGAICDVVLGCTIGNDNSVSAVPGDPSYVAEGYVQAGYQHYNDVITLLPTSSDLAYTQPEYRATDDGLVFPLTPEQILLLDEERRHGDMYGAVSSALAAMAEAAKITPAYDKQSAIKKNQQQLALSGNSVANATADNPIWIEYHIKPVNSGPFHAVYNVKFSEFTVAKQVDLESETT